jgi:hypothetical protein
VRTYFEKLLLNLDLADELSGQKFESAIKKLSGGRREVGAKCSWCYDDDVQFWKEDNLHGRTIPHPMHWFYGGILIPTPDYELRGEIDYETCVVVVTNYPVEKGYVETDWTPLLTILTTPQIHRFHIMETIRPARPLPV